jgi:hypothetical protein
MICWKSVTIATKALIPAVCFAVGVFQQQAGYAQESTQTSPAQSTQSEAQPTDPAPESPEQIQALIAPIALYPDALVPGFFWCDISGSDLARPELDAAAQGPEQPGVDEGSRAAKLGSKITLK